MESFNVVVTVSTTVCIDAENPDDAIEKVSQALNNGDANMSADVASNICLLSLRGITGDDQIAQWDTRFDAKGKKVLDDAE